MLVKQIKTISHGSLGMAAREANEFLATIPAETVLDVDFKPFRFGGGDAVMAIITILAEESPCEKKQ